jgi:ATP-dependent DNA ligase
VVIGYVPATDAVPFTLLIATLREDKLTFAGPVRDGISQRALKELQQRLPEIEQQEPVLRGLHYFNAVWVRPEIFCEIRQDGFDRDGFFLRPAFKSLLRN